MTRHYIAHLYRSHSAFGGALESGDLERDVWSETPWQADDIAGSLAEFYGAYSYDLREA